MHCNWKTDDREWYTDEFWVKLYIQFVYCFFSSSLERNHYPTFFFKWWKWWDICTVRKMLMTMIFFNPYCQWEKHLHETQSLILFCLVCSLHLFLSQTSSFFHRSHSQSQSPHVYIHRIRRSSNCHLSHSYQHHHSGWTFSCLLWQKKKALEMFITGAELLLLKQLDLNRFLLNHQFKIR